MNVMRTPPNPSIEFPLVITTAFSPRSDVPYLALKKGGVRTRETLYSILWWICKSDFDKIVVVDTTADESLSGPLVALARSCGKQLEYIAVENDDECVVRYGKGFGEGFAIDVALGKSSLLMDQSGFFKCTGKVIVENYRECVDQARSKDFYFDAPRGTNRYLETRFYYVSKLFWNANLRDAYRNVNDSKGVFLEHAYYDSIKRVCDIPFNPVVIRFRGISGTVGDVYGSSPAMYLLRRSWRRSYGLFDRLRSKFVRP